MTTVQRRKILKALRLQHDARQRLADLRGRDAQTAIHQAINEARREIADCQREIERCLQEK